MEVLELNVLNDFFFYYTSNHAHFIALNSVKFKLAYMRKLPPKISEK